MFEIVRESNEYGGDYAVEQHIGELIRRKRKEMGLTLQDLAGPQLSVPTISNIERGVTRHISQDKLDYLLNRLGLSLDELKEVAQEEEELEDFFEIKLDQINSLILNHCYDEAESRLKALEHEERKKGNPTHLCRLTFFRGKNFMYQKKYDRAEWEFHNVIRRAKELHVPEETNIISEAYGNLGYISYYQNNFNAAIRYTKQALKTFNPNGERPYLKGRQLHNLALYYERIGKANQAYGLTVEAMSIAQENNDYYSLISIYILKAIIQQNYYNVEDAIETLKEAQKFLHLTNDPKLTGILWNNLGENYFLTENYDMAEQCFKTSLSIKHKHLSSEYLIRTFMFLGQISVKRGLFQKGKEDLHQAVELAEKTANHKYLSEALLMLADIYMELEEKDSAQEVLEKAFDLAKKHGFSKEHKEATVLLAQLHEHTDNEKFLKYMGELYALEKEYVKGGII